MSGVVRCWRRRVDWSCDVEMSGWEVDVREGVREVTWVDWVADLGSGWRPAGGPRGTWDPGWGNLGVLAGGPGDVRRSGGVGSQVPRRTWEKLGSGRGKK
jgi:hypothetical protein